MRKIQIVLICAACLFFVTSTVTAQKVKETMTNADVVEMVKAGVAESNIVSKIQQSEPNFDTSIKAVIELTKQGVSQKIIDAMLQPQIAKPLQQNRPDNINAIATKDIGPLRVVLRSMIRLKLPDRWGNINVNGVRCTFEFINLETQRPIVVAMNAAAPDQAMNHLGATMGSYLRSTLIDEYGDLLRLRSSDVAGITVVGVGQQRFPGPYYNPAEIVAALSRRDDSNSDVSQFTNGSSKGDYRFIFGSTTEMSPGQSLTVNLSFSQNENQREFDSPPKIFQMATEIVVGSLTSGTKKSYKLYNLTFDRVSPK